MAHGRRSRLLGTITLAVLLAPRIAEAQDIDACIAASENAVAERRTGRLILERGSLATCAASSCPEPVRASCLGRLAQAEKAIPSIVFIARDESGHDVTSVTVRIDGAAHATPLDGRAIALDPGKHELRFDAAGHTPVARELVLHEGEQGRTETIVLLSSATAASGDARAHALSTPELGGRRILALTFGALGLYGLGTGILFGLKANSAWQSAKAACNGNTGQCSGGAVLTAESYRSTAIDDGAVATVSVVAGAASLVAGAILFATGKGSRRVGVRVTPSMSVESNIGPGATGLFLTGTFL